MSEVMFAPVALRKVEAKRTLTARYDGILKRLITREMVEEKSVAVKVHLGGEETYTCIPPTFIRRTIQRIREAGGFPFLTDSNARYNLSCGYTHEVLGCLVHPAAGLLNRYFYTKKTGSTLLPKVEVAGFIHDADVLINLSHAKGHGHAAYGGAIKNLGMGAVTNNMRTAVHSTMQSSFKWDSKRCVRCGVCIEQCRGKAMKFDEKGKLTIFDHDCLFCGRCVALCTQKAITINESLWPKFQRALVLSAREVLRTFEADRVLHINVILNVTALCDCFGMGQPSLVPDVGIMLSRDIVALEQATLDAIGKQPFFPEALPGGRQALGESLHPFYRAWGKDPYVQVAGAARLKMGTRKYQLRKVA